MKTPPLICAMAFGACLVTAQAQPQIPPRGDGPPPAYGPGMMGGYGQSGGYGPGMMRGYGPGYGPGMPGNYGRGYGMMDGMMGPGPVYGLDLSEQQLVKVNQIQDEVRRKNWAIMGKLQDEQAHLRDLFLADKRDPAAIGKQALKLAELRRQMLETSVDAQNRIEALLSKEQKERLRQLDRGWYFGHE